MSGYRFDDLHAPCDLTGCQCGGVSDLATLSRCGPATAGLLDRLSTPAPAGESGSGAALDAQGGNPEPGLAASMRLRVYDEGGRMMGALYHRLSDAVEACIGQPGRRTIYRETAEGDLMLLCRVSGRKG